MEQIKWIFSGIGVTLISFAKGILGQKSDLTKNKIHIGRSQDVSVRGNNNLDVDVNHSSNVKIEDNNK